MKCPRCQEETKVLTDSGHCPDCEDFLMEIFDILKSDDDEYATSQARDDTGYRRPSHEA